MVITKPQVEAKVYGAFIGGSVGTVVAKAILWAVGVLFFGVTPSASTGQDAISAVPGPLSDLISGAITLGAVAVGGYMARHTPRPPESEPGAQLDPDQAVEVPHAEHLDSPAQRATVAVRADVDPRDLDGNGRDDKTGRYIAKAVQS